MTADQIITFLTPILVPLLLAGVKALMPKLPSWTIPMLAPLMGILIDILNAQVTAHQSNIWVAAGLGLAGVGLREVKDQVLPAQNGGWKAPDALGVK
jgi:hypothetical protein